MQLIYLLVALGATIVGAISGIGGGVIIKPLLDSISPLGVSTISFLSGTTVLSMSAVSLLRSRKRGVKINLRSTSAMAFGGVLGGMFGKYLFDIVRTSYGNDQVIGATQSILLFIITFGVLLFTLNKDRITPMHITTMFFSIFIGFLLGAMGSFLGIGGGPINLTVLFLFFAMDSKTAAINSLFIIFFSQLTNFIFTIASGNIPEFDPVVLGIMVAGGIIGGMTGSSLSHKMSNRAVDRLFIAVICVILLLCVYNSYTWLS